MLEGNKEGHGHPMFYKILREIAELHSRKNKDYATMAEPWGNFERVAEIAKRYGLITAGNEREKVAIIYMLKQLDAVLKLVGSGQKGEVEGVPERLRDIAVYAPIIEIMYRETEEANGKK